MKQNKNPFMDDHAGLKIHRKILLSVLSYGLLFLPLCLAVRFLSAAGGFKVHKVFSSFSWDAVATGMLGREVLFFAGAQILLHLGFGALIFLMSLGIGNLFKLQGKNLVALGRGLTIFAFLFLLLKNAELHPYSFYARFFEDFLQTPFGAGLVLSLEIGLGVLFFLSLCYHLGTAWRRASGWRTPAIAAAVLGAVGFLLMQHAGRSDAEQPHFSGQPNIFIIGVDSLRPDHVGYLGYPRMTTPHLDAFLKKGTIFPEAITPLGRTFPSWTSVLTGQYPRTSGARFNLIGKSQLRFEKTLGDLLREKGYITVYACDEKRFANFDGSYGFDFVLGPGMGAADFLLGSLGDLPLSNLVVNTRLGKALFPFSYGNRAADATYQPAVFSREIAKFFDRPLQKPLFFAVHFCLPHYPYRWNGDRDEVIEGPTPHGQMREHIEAYDRSLHAADRQVGDLMALLRERKMLKNAVVILISDHGESFFDKEGDLLFEKGKDTLAPGKPQALALIRKWGHGSSLLSYSQNRCLLAFRDFRRDYRNGEVRSERVSLVDIAPTLLDYLGLQDGARFDGISLNSFLTGKEEAALSERLIFLETGFNPTEGEMDVPEMIKKGLRFYEIDSKEGLLSLKPGHLPELIGRKERAVFRGDYYLVAAEFHGGKRILALDMTSGRWTSDLDYIRKSFPFQGMLSQMVSFYGEELEWLRMAPDSKEGHEHTVPEVPRLH